MHAELDSKIIREHCCSYMGYAYFERGNRPQTLRFSSMLFLIVHSQLRRLHTCSCTFFIKRRRKLEGVATAIEESETIE